MRQVGNPRNLERLTGELYYKPTGETGFINIGDVVMFKETPETETVAGKFHTRAATERQVRLDTKSTTMRWEVEAQERTLEIEAILMHGLAGAVFTQNAVAMDATVVLESVAPGRVYEIGKLSLTEVSAAIGEDALVVGEMVDGELEPANADVAIDKALGHLYVSKNGGVEEGADITVTYKADAVEMAKITEIGEHVTRTGSFKLVGYDGSSRPARKIFTFDGELKPKDRGENKVDDYNKFSFEIIATGDVTELVAQD